MAKAVLDYLKLKALKDELIAQYGNICFLGGILSFQNNLTCHHIIKQEQDESLLYDIDNLALIARLEHEIIHLLERVRPRVYKESNDYLRYFKEHNDMLAREQLHLYLLHKVCLLGYEPFEKNNMLILKRNRKWDSPHEKENLEMIWIALCHYSEIFESERLGQHFFSDIKPIDLEALARKEKIKLLKDAANYYQTYITDLETRSTQQLIKTLY